MKIPGYLEQRRRGWYAVVDVPPSIRKLVGKNRYRRSLKTPDKDVAKARLPKALLEIHRQLEEARRKRPETDPLMAEAMAWRETMSEARAGHPSGLPTKTVVDERGEEHEEPDFGLVEDLIETRHSDIAREQGEARATVFADIATGRATPTTLHLDEWLSEHGKRGPRRPRTSADYRGIVKAFSQWAAGADWGASVERVSRRAAGLFVQHQQKTLSATRVRTIIAALLGYWAWMEKRGVMAADHPNPWERQAPSKPRRGDGEDEERAFTDTELATLLGGTDDAFLLDLMRVAALTGMRIEEIARLTVGMCGASVIRAPGVKGVKLSVPRDVPMHPDLTPIITMRTKDRDAKEFLFHEIGPANKFGERSAAASKKFSRYRQAVGVHQREQGRRRSQVNFHSFRRWFSTRALGAGQEACIIKAVIGHKQDHGDVLMRSYVTLGQLPHKLQACVDAVKLPCPAPPPLQVLYLKA